MRRHRLVAVGLSVLAAIVSGHADGLAAEAVGEIRSAGGVTAVADSYIVVLKDGTATAERAQRLAGEHDGTVQRVYTSALQGFEARLTEQAAKRLAVDPAVDYVEQNHTVSAADTQWNPAWGLDRTDQAALPLTNEYTFPNTGVGVTAYVLDTGIRLSHEEFGGRAKSGFDAVDGTRTDDCNGHGTHVAGVLGGARYGMAKGVSLVSVRVLDCSANGTFAQLIAGVDWVTANTVKPAVANISLNGATNAAVNAAVAKSIASGVAYAVAASNQGDDACTRSPASAPDAITVGATENNDTRAPYSNYGPCLDIFAPGTDIVAATGSGDIATDTRSGTSMSAPHVAGAAALLLSQNPGWTPGQVRDHLVARATSGVVTDAGTGSPNLLLRVDNAGTPPPPQLMPLPVPVGVLDTRDGTGGTSGQRGPATTTTFPVLGVGGIPAAGVKAGARAGRVQRAVGRDIPHGVAGSDHSPGAAVNTGLRPTASRVLDTRTEQAVAAGATIDVQVAGVAGVPVTRVAGVVLDLTAAGPQKPGYLMAWPVGEAQPSVTLMDFDGSGARANTVVLTPGTSGKVRIKNGSTAPIHVLVDVQGWFGAA